MLLGDVPGALGVQDAPKAHVALVVPAEPPTPSPSPALAPMQIPAPEDIQMYDMLM